METNTSYRDYKTQSRASSPAPHASLLLTTRVDAELGLTVLAPGIALFALIAVVAQFAHPV